MKLQQLRYLCEVEKQGLSVSDAALALHTSQPGISKQIRLLEEELGVELLVRSGKRVVDLTEPGRAIVAVAQRVLRETINLKRVAEDYHAEDTGTFTIATTHTQARYSLPKVIKQFSERYPKVRLTLHQGNPGQIAGEVVAGKADLGIATESLADVAELVSLPCYDWHHCLVTTSDHPLLNQGSISLFDIARYPIITYDTAFAGRNKINRAFEQQGVTPNIILSALDADVIKAYVALGLGIGIVAKMAFEAERDLGLRMIEIDDLFPLNTTRIAFRRDGYLRRYVYDFIELFAPRLTHDAVERSRTGEADAYVI
jgi:LysR family transcriptional regulator, cys regulon transcriptional activator